MAVRSEVGFDVDDLTSVEALFGEHPSRVIVCVDPDKLGEVHRRHVNAGVAAKLLGTAEGDRLVVEGVLDIALDDVRNAWRDRLPAALSGGTMQ